MTETPGRAAYQAFMRKLYADAFEHWSYLDADTREAWEAAAQVVLLSKWETEER